MLQYDKDGVTLFYTDATGNKVSASPFDGAKYSAMLMVLDAQIAAASANTQAVANYNNVLAGAQANVNAGRPAIAPPKPLQTVVSDTGVTTYVAFAPPLADLVPLANVTPSGPIAVPTADTEAIEFAMITAIYRKMFPST